MCGTVKGSDRRGRQGEGGTDDVEEWCVEQ